MISVNVCVRKMLPTDVWKGEIIVLMCLNLEQAGSLTWAQKMFPSRPVVLFANKPVPCRSHNMFCFTKQLTLHNLIQHIFWFMSCLFTLSPALSECTHLSNVGFCIIVCCIICFFLCLELPWLGEASSCWNKAGLDGAKLVRLDHFLLCYGGGFGFSLLALYSAIVSIHLL